jgi:hypothetical protein
MQHIVDETNKQARQKITSAMSFTFYSRIRKWHNVTVGKMYDILALFTLMGILQKLERLEFTVRFLHFIDNFTVNKYQIPARLTKCIQLFNT